jgi:hypothetical protein
VHGLVSPAEWLSAQKGTFRRGEKIDARFDVSTNQISVAI